MENKDFAHETLQSIQRMHDKEFIQLSERRTNISNIKNSTTYIQVPWYGIQTMIRDNKDLAHEILHSIERIHDMECSDQREQRART